MITSPGTWTKRLWGDGTLVTIAATPTNLGYGYYSIVLSTGEMNYDTVSILINDSTSGCIPYSTTLKTSAYTLDEIVASLATETEVATAVDAVMTESGIQKNTALNNFSFFMYSSTDHVSGATGKTITAQRSIDGGAFASCANGASEVAYGFYKINLAAADLNGDMVSLRFTATGADPTVIVIKTSS